jgi:hypothetical protein
MLDGIDIGVRVGYSFYAGNIWAVSLKLPDLGAVWGFGTGISY